MANVWLQIEIFKYVFQICTRWSFFTM